MSLGQRWRWLKAVWSWAGTRDDLPGPLWIVRLRLVWLALTAGDVEEPPNG
jgi:hypothetical protein